MDLALAHDGARQARAGGQAARRLAAHGAHPRLPARQGDAPARTRTSTSVPVVVPSRGSKLVGGSIRTELTREEVDADPGRGLLPGGRGRRAPEARARGALTQLGLPYAQDAAITRHLAAFLGQAARRDRVDSRASERAARGRELPAPDGDPLQRRRLQLAAPRGPRRARCINGWLEAEGAPPARVLEGADLDVAVARGAAYYAYVRRGEGVRIRGGTAQAYYVGVETAMPAVPGLEPPLSRRVRRALRHRRRQRVRARAAGARAGGRRAGRASASSARRSAATTTWAPCSSAGATTSSRSCPRSRPASRPRAATRARSCPVRLRAAVTEVGTLRLEAVPRAGKERWKVELDVRTAD